jgi:acyl phosphate:glycerol-3-phosphate acyltransferase
LDVTSIFTTVGMLSVAYLLGSIPSGLLIVRALTGKDVREHGSGNIGMVNVFRTAGNTAGVLTFLMDGLKGFVPVFIASATGMPTWLVLASASAAILGHNWSIVLGGRGGKGIATSVGTIGAISPLIGLSAILAWLVLLTWTRYASLSSLVMLALIPPVLALAGYDWPYVLYASALLVLAIMQHRPNIERLRRGSELKFSLGSSRSPIVRHGD